MNCWHCNQPFAKFRGLDTFVVIVAHGEQHRVHKCCAGTIEREKFYTPLTAQPSMSRTDVEIEQ